MSNDLCIGRFLVINERNGTGNVYDDDGQGELVHHAETFEAACKWARREDGGWLATDETEAPAEPVRAAQKKPCRQCPFRRKAAAGWLGAANPESFVGNIMIDAEPLPCHSTIDYARPDWRAKWLAGTYRNARLCAGALTLAANMKKMPRMPHCAMPVDTGTVFATYAEFVEHHRGSKVTSWEEPIGFELDGVNEIRRHIKLPVLK